MPNNNTLSSGPPYARAIIPPSVKDSKPYINPESLRTSKRAQRDTEILDSIEESVKRGEYKDHPTSMWTKFGFVFFSSFVFLGGFVVYQTSKGKPAFFPLWFRKVVPLAKADGVNKINLEALKRATKESLLIKLSMNGQVKQLFGLPLQLGEFERFDVSIEYRDYSMEGLQVDCSKQWWKPEFSIKKIMVSIPENFGGMLEPLKTNGEIDYDAIDKKFPNQRDYSILIDGRISAMGNSNSIVDKGSGAITFRGLIEFDHTKTIKLVNVLLSYKTNGNASIEKLW
ncbi:hypothetical protein FOA43_003592 [Brettanomyces nanus]|uniref:Uncharacterized protein n=1 Tax=Eeniella nana TaxID=13502 RepID=A0A875S4H1_EENNA|nr:uncharacterized protein FOA43_003592 [Brettanomyces nanus]QPG76206.1 hypothetical protein FOA43_003592 [Brettanomyces nanus]